MNRMDTAALSVERLRVEHGGVRAVSEVTLAVAPGEVVAVLGANGAGKSSLLRATMGLGTCEGTVRLAGVDVSRKPAWARARAGLAYVPEGRRLFPGLTARENLDVAARVGAAERRERMARVLALFPAIAARLDARGWTLSGGEQQRVAIGRALMQAPRALMLDEPTLGLAPALAREVFAALRRIAASGVAVLVAEQNALGVLATADRAAVLVRGVLAREMAAGALDTTDLDALLMG